MVDTHEVDVAGISAVLSRFSNRIQLVEDTPGAGIDVILYGVREQQPGHDAGLHSLLRTHAATVIALGWSGDTPQALWALSCGAQAHLSKTLTGHELVARVEQVHRAHGRSRELPADGHCHPAVRGAPG